MEDVGLLESESPPPPPSTRKKPAAGAAPAASSKTDGSGTGQEPSMAESVWSSVTGMMGFGGRDDSSGSRTSGSEVVVAGVDGGEGGGDGRALARKGEDEGEEGERVHVFSLATGHLYERFLKVGWVGCRLEVPKGARGATRGCRCSRYKMVLRVLVDYLGGVACFVGLVAWVWCSE